MNTNVILCGDNLERLTEIPDNSIDLIYADPPFFSNKHYEIIWNDGAELRAFKDRWQGGINQYIRWMRPRLAECRRILKDTGSIYLHCDSHAHAYLKIVMDAIFGINNFRSEIIWWYPNKLQDTRKKLFAKENDTILFYVKNESSDFTFNHQYIKRDKPVKHAKIHKVNGIKKTVKDSLGNTQYLISDKRVIGNIWTIPMLTGGRERIGYPTQKPEALLKRIIESSSNKGDIVLDPFCGCGTTIAVAQQLERKWMGIDVSPTACRMMAERLNKIGVIVEIDGMPDTIEHLKALEPFNFQEWVVNRIKGTHNSKKSGDMGVDGWTFLKHEPIQVKQSSNIGRNVVDNFETAIRRARHIYGEIYAFSFARSAYEEVARAQNEDGIEIKLIKVEELLPISTMNPTAKQKQLV